MWPSSCDLAWRGAEAGSGPYPQPLSFTSKAISLFQHPLAQQIWSKPLPIKKAPGPAPVGIHIQPEAPEL